MQTLLNCIANIYKYYRYWISISDKCGSLVPSASSTKLNLTQPNSTQLKPTQHDPNSPSTMASIWVAFFSRSGTPRGCKGPSFRDVDNLPLLSFRTSKLSLGAMVGLREFRVLPSLFNSPPASWKPDRPEAVSWQML